MSKIIEKEWKDGDFKCKVLFKPMGHRCGYVGVPKGHHMYGLNYEEYIDEIDCHGGLTYSGFLGEENKEYWYFGFDCAHFGDGIDIKALRKYGFKREVDIIKKQELILGSLIELEEPFKTQEFCEEQCHSIVEQIKQL
ncbi:MAG: hypothetical protein ACLR02_10000 [Clostridium sp.]